MAQPKSSHSQDSQPSEGSSIGVEGRLASECTKASEWIEAWPVESIVEWAEERRRKGSTSIFIPLLDPCFFQDGNCGEGNFNIERRVVGRWQIAAISRLVY